MLKLPAIFRPDALISLFFPNLCLSCNNHLTSKEADICLVCQANLPETRFHESVDNPMLEKFVGRVKIEQAAALYYFVKGSRVRELVHQLKYEGKQRIGIQLGTYYGQKLAEIQHFQQVHYIFPVPLHPKKERQRGYNQSSTFAQGLSKTLHRPWRADVLTRGVYTETQTKKTKTERFDNVKDAFVVKNPSQMEGKHILLVDDVMTTGATLEACALELLKVKDVKVSIVTIAYATDFQ